jgi:hypothetical protein
MHDCTEMPVRSYLVTLMDAERTPHLIQVDTPCTCDMWDFVRKLDLPITPAYMSILDMEAPIEACA